MICTSCGHTNPERAKFCLECGTPVAARCSACDGVLPPGTKFCGECGAATTVPAKQVTEKERPLRDARDYTLRHLADKILARDLLPLVEEPCAELARLRSDATGCEHALRAAARMHREHGEEWLATSAEARFGT